MLRSAFALHQVERVFELTIVNYKLKNNNKKKPKEIIHLSIYNTCAERPPKKQPIFTKNYNIIKKTN